jgi:phosphoenolpyruvate carboxykinase (ATP)
MEGGVYPIVLGITEKNEPTLYRAALTPRAPEDNRALFQNVVVDADGHIDVDDKSLTANTRVSVPMEYIEGSKESGEAGPPNNIFFITKDVGGFLPPIAKLTHEQSMYWFLMGPTSNTAAQTGEPGATFSPFFGGPFMSRHPAVYMELLGDAIQTHQPDIWLVNTGFTGGSEAGDGTRIGIPETKAMVGAALRGEFDDVEFREDERFHIMVPKEVPGSKTATDLLVPRDTWEDPAEYDRQADAFAAQFLSHFQAKYAGDPSLADFEQFSPAPLESE